MEDERKSGPGASSDREGDSDQYSWKRDTELRRQRDGVPASTELGKSMEAALAADGAGVGISHGPAGLVRVEKTSSLRLSEVEACSFCEEFVGSEFRVLDVRFGVVRELLDETSLRCQGFPEAVARALAMQPEAGVVIGEDPAFTVRLYLCRTCFDPPVDIPMALARTIARRALLAARRTRNRHVPMNLTSGAEVADPVWKDGDYVRFAHIPPGGPAHRVELVCPDGMIEIQGMTGRFAASIFVRADMSGGDSESVGDAALGDK